MLFGVIYKSTILIPESSFYGKFVIGKKVCKSIERFYKKRYIGSSKIIGRVKRKYGMDRIKTDIVYQMFDDNLQTQKEKHKQLGDWERHFIKLYNSQNPEIGINLTEGGDGIRGYKYTEEQKRKLSDGLRGYKYSENRNKKISETKKEYHKNHPGNRKGKKNFCIKPTETQIKEIQLNVILSTRALAKKLGISQRQVRKIERIKIGGEQKCQNC